MKIIKIFIFIFSLFIFINFVNADNCGGSIQCECGDTLVESQTMWYDLNNCLGHGIIIGANNIILNCNSHLIDGDDTGTSDYGVYINNHNSVSIQNCYIKEFSRGIHLWNSPNNLLDHNIANNNTAYGISIAYNSDNNILSNNVANYNDNGIFFEQGIVNGTLTNNIANYNYYNGIFLYGGNIHEISLINNTANNNGWRGIDLYSNYDNTLLNNIAKYNNIGIYSYGSPRNNNISGNDISNNYYGIRISISSLSIGYNFLSDNNINNNQEIGIYLGGGSSNKIIGNNINNNTNGIYLHSSNNEIINNNIKENTNLDVAMQYVSYAYNCNNIFNGNNLSGNLPLGYFNYTVNLKDETFSELILCNAHNSRVNNVTVIGSENLQNNGFFVIRTNNSEFVNIDSSNNYIGIWLYRSSDNILTDNTLSNNIGGIYLNSYSFYNNITKNYFTENSYGINLTFNSSYNKIWNNIFLYNGVNAFEYSASNNNRWNISIIGNYWSDFESNIGYPNYYEIPGPGNGIDFSPLNLGYYIDDTNPEFVIISGEWNLRNIENAYNNEAMYNEAGFGDEMATWKVNELVFPGTYDVYVWKFEHNYSSLMGTNVHYMVYHRLGTSNWILVNQQTLGNEWIYLGEFEFDNSHRQGIMITNEANGIVSADAIKLVYQGPLGNLDSSGSDLFDLKI